MADAGFTAFPERHSSECPDKIKQYLKTTGCVIICFSVLQFHISSNYLWLFYVIVQTLSPRGHSVQNHVRRFSKQQNSSKYYNFHMCTHSYEYYYFHMCQCEPTSLCSISFNIVLISVPRLAMGLSSGMLSHLLKQDFQILKY